MSRKKRRIELVDSLRLDQLPPNGVLTSTMFRTQEAIYTHPDNVLANGSTIGQAVIGWLAGIGAKRHPASQKELDHMIRSPPLLVRPTAENDLDYVFVDIQAAYPSIYTRLRWEDEVTVNGTKRGSTSLASFPLLENKKARSAVVGIAHGGSSYIVKDSQIVSERRWSGNYNPHLISLIMTVMHDVASYAARNGCIYWNTDGGIMPRIGAIRVQRYARELYGLNLREQAQGRAEVIAAGVYRVGDKVSIPYQAGLTRPRRISKLQSVARQDVLSISWLLNQE